MFCSMKIRSSFFHSVLPSLMRMPTTWFWVEVTSCRTPSIVNAIGEA